MQTGVVARAGHSGSNLQRLSLLLALLTLAPACAARAGAPARRKHMQDGVSIQDALDTHTATGYRASGAECLDDPSDWGLPVALPFWRSSGQPISPGSVHRACTRGAQAKVSLIQQRMRHTVPLKNGRAPSNHIQSSTGLCKGEALLHQLSGLVLVPFGKGGPSRIIPAFPNLSLS